MAQTNMISKMIWGALVVVLTALPALAVEPEAHWDNLLQTMRARALLFEDEQLGPLNLGVRVRQRVAVLWGPVPSAALSQRAEVRLRTMIELMEVHNELYIDHSDPNRPARPATPLFSPANPLSEPAPKEQRQLPNSVLGPPQELIGYR